MNTNITTKQRIQIIKGVPYVYEDFPYWDADKKQTRHKREYIGKLNSNGHFVPNKLYTARHKSEDMANKGDAIKIEKPVTRNYYGATYLLDAIGKNIGIVADLKTSFPNDYKKLLSLAYYLILENEGPMYRFSKWAKNHNHPFGYDLPSQRISELLASVSEESKMKFFKLQGKRRSEREYLAYDTTSISSYSELISHVKYGKNKDGDRLPQVNLALIFGEESMLPVYYRKLPGNITDVKTLRKLLKDIGYLELNKVKLVMDRGFYSAKNINDMYRSHYKFVIGTKCNTKFAASLLEKVRESIKDFSNYDKEQNIYCVGSMEKWPYEEYDEKGKVILKAERRIYAHIYYNGQRAEDEKTAFIRLLADAEENMLTETCSENQKILCNKYFNIKSTPVRGMKIEYNENVIRDHVKNFGYFILLSNEIKDSSNTLAIYRNKDLIEKSFGNLKNRLNMRRTGVSSDENLEGKLFIQFIALIYVSSVHKCMKDNQLYSNYSMQTLFDELDIIELFDYPGQSYHCSEITAKQQQIYECFGVNPPNML
jgi:transposase